MHNQQVNELENSIEAHQASIKKLETLNRLFEYKPFQELILGDYLKEEAVRLVYMKADPSLQTPEKQAYILRCMDGIGALSGYFDTIRFMGDISKRSIEDDRNTLADVLANS